MKDFEEKAEAEKAVATIEVEDEDGTAASTLNRLRRSSKRSIVEVADRFIRSGRLRSVDSWSWRDHRRCHGGGRRCSVAAVARQRRHRCRRRRGHRLHPADGHPVPHLPLLGMSGTSCGHMPMSILRRRVKPLHHGPRLPQSFWPHPASRSSPMDSSRPAAWRAAAVMATKTIENEMDRRMTIMTTTMIPCGAKMPIIALVFGAPLATRALFATIPGGSAPLFYFAWALARLSSLRHHAEEDRQAMLFVPSRPRRSLWSCLNILHA